MPGRSCSDFSTCATAGTVLCPRNTSPFFFFWGGGPGEPPLPRHSSQMRSLHTNRRHLPGVPVPCRAVAQSSRSWRSTRQAAGPTSAGPPPSSRAGRGRRLGPPRRPGPPRLRVKRLPPRPRHPQRRQPSPGRLQARPAAPQHPPRRTGPRQAGTAISSDHAGLELVPARPDSLGIREWSCSRSALLFLTARRSSFRPWPGTASLPTPLPVLAPSQSWILGSSVLTTASEGASSYALLPVALFRINIEPKPRADCDRWSTCISTFNRTVLPKSLP